MAVATKTRKQPTEAQKAAAAERRERMRKIAQTVSSLSQEQREALAARFGIRTIEGRQLSVFNQCMLVNQSENVTIVGGFQQWRNAGRVVRKGEHALAIWIPTGNADEEPEGDEIEDGHRQRFILGNVFDISQTDEIEAAS